MAVPTSRSSLREYCLRKLGAPVLEVNVDSDQVEDCIDDALQVWAEFHADAVKRMYLSYQVTAADVANKYVPVDDDVQAVVRMLPISTSSVGTGTGMFSIRYQMALNRDLSPDATNFWIGDLAYYSQMSQYLDTLDMVLSGTPQVTFQRYENRLYIFGEWWDQEIREGTWIVLEVYKFVDRDTNVKVWNDRYVKELATALIRTRWGDNLSKFVGVQLIGGVTMSGDTIAQLGRSEYDAAYQRLRDECEPMPEFFIG